jgi:predicted NAD-dependent protein-ADP-ribosyltransferase YbiA (DUF1768 family)
MVIRNPTYRTLDDGERVEGTWRHAFINNGGLYFLTDLKIYTDGLIDCWGLVNIDEFREKLRIGWIATTIAENANVSAHHLASWQAVNSQCIDAEMLISEVLDTIAELQGSPTSSERFGIVLNSFLAEETETNRAQLRAAYFEIPEHMRRYVLGSQDMADWPVQIIVGELGDLVFPRNPSLAPRPITEDDRQRVRDYFAARERREVEWKSKTNNNDPDGPPIESNSSVGAGGTAIAPSGGWVDPSGDGYLSNDTPYPITINGVEYLSVTHAYWSMSTSDPDSAVTIRRALKAVEAAKLGAAAPRRSNWSKVRLAVMTNLMRSKFDQHPDLAAKLLSTEDARILSPHSFSGSYWAPGSKGRNWVGRILELIRSELVLREFDPR